MTTENTTTTEQEKDHKAEGDKNSNKARQRVISHPTDVASLVMIQIDAVNSKKDDLTIAIKGLADTAKQLVRSYAQQTAAIEALQRRVKALEDAARAKNGQ